MPPLLLLSLLSLLLLVLLELCSSLLSLSTEVDASFLPGVVECPRHCSNMFLCPAFVLLE